MDTITPVRPTCSIPGCTNAARNRGWCSTHYARWYRHGDTHRVVTRSYPRLPLAERFWRHVDCSSPESCWVYQGFTNYSGYGLFTVSPKHDGGLRNRRAHRLAWELTNGPVPDGFDVCHRCDNPPCCNPSHLFLGTQRENNKDKYAKGRQVVGERIGNAKLTENQVRAIREKNAEGVGSRRLAVEYGITRNCIRKIIQHKAWTHVA